MPAIPEERPTVFDDPPPDAEQEIRTGDVPLQQQQQQQSHAGHMRQVTEQEPDPGPQTPRDQQLPQQPAPVAPFVAQLHQAMRNPQRLDGHPGGSYGLPRTAPEPSYGPQGGGARVFTGLILEKLSKRMIGLLDAKIYLTDLLIDVWLMRQSTLTIPCLMTPHATRENPKLEAFLTGKAVRSEIDLNDLSVEDRAKFDQSMEKEWKLFQEV